VYIIVRACGERTERECIKQARKQGTVYVVREHPFGESIRKTYELAIELNQKWMPVIDADVILSPGTLSKAVKWLDGQKKNVFCLDGKTKDKIMMSIRRAGIHIYRTSLLPDAMRYIDDSRVKPESHVRKSMEKHGYKTVVGGIVFGVHDYEQYYVDLWRKSVCQTKKLGGVIRKTNITKKWALLAKRDDDYRVILAAHNHGIKHASKIIIDSRITYGAEEGIAALGLKEKGEM
jgi:hypothetical protein